MEPNQEVCAANEDKRVVVEVTPSTGFDYTVKTTNTYYDAPRHRDEWVVKIVTDDGLSDILNAMSRDGYDVFRVFRNAPCKSAERGVETTTVIFEKKIAYEIPVCFKNGKPHYAHKTCDAGSGVEFP